MVKSMCGYTIFYQIDNNVMLSMEQHQVKLKSEVAYPKDVWICHFCDLRSELGPLLFLIHISDINYEIADSTVSCFADDTRVLLGIEKMKRTHRCYKMITEALQMGRYK